MKQAYLVLVCVFALSLGASLGFCSDSGLLEAPHQISVSSAPVESQEMLPAEETTSILEQDPLANQTPVEDEFIPTEKLAAQPDTRWVAQNDAPASEVAPAPDVQHKIVSTPTTDSLGGGLSLTVDMTWVSKYMFRGIDVYDDRGAWQPSVDIGLWDTGFHVNWWTSFASTGRDQYRDLDEYDYTFYWTGTPCEGLDVTLGMVYYDIFRQASENADFWEWYGNFTLSSLPLSPHMNVYYALPYDDDLGGEGWMTCLGVSHNLPLCGMTLGGSDPLEMALTADIWYNGGAYVNGQDTGWSHAVFGGKVPISLPCNLTFSPGVYYQVSMEDTINPEDDWWTSLSLTYNW